MTAKNLFLKGLYRDILLNKDQYSMDPLSVLGAYCMTSQPEEGEKLLSQLESDFLNQGLFFLILGFTRISEYKKAEKLIRELRIITRKTKNKFFLYQAIAFYRFFCCRYKHAERWLISANKYVAKIDQPFFELLHLDLLGQTLIKRGSVQRGFQCLENALIISKKIDNKFTTEALIVSIVIFHSQFSIDQSQSLIKLKKLMKGFEKSQNYFFINLTLEYSRRMNLIGAFSESDRVLNSLREILFSTALNRQKALWGLRKSHLLYLQGDIEEGINLIDSSLEYLDLKVDLLIQLQLLGMKFKLLKKIGQSTFELENEIKSLTFLTYETTALSYAYRYKWISKPVTEDPYAQFFHGWLGDEFKSFNIIKKIIQLKWFSLFVDLRKIEHKNFLLMDVLPKKAILMTPEKIFYLNGVTPVIRQAFLLLSGRNHSKKDFVQLLWGYDYDPYYHDASLNTLIYRLRDFLGFKNDHLVSVKEGHIWAMSLFVRAYEYKKNFQEKLNNKAKSFKSDHLNYRQIQFLESIAQNQYSSTLEYCTKFKVNKMTACRDLKFLIDLNLIKKIGQGRATKYSLL